MSDRTYEATMARQKTVQQRDPIHWEKRAAFRDQPYRQLVHQKGIMGTIQVRLLEAADLERSYWSALALGPVKHLGLSTAHGAVSSFCTFTLDAEPHNQQDTTTQQQQQQHSDISTFTQSADRDRKMPAKTTTSEQQRPTSFPVVSSPVVSQDNNPVWSDCNFDLPLKKASLWEDGMRIHLKVRVDEDSHVAERFIPGMPKGDDRLLGRGTVDLTSLCLGEKLSGQPQVGVLDAWIPIYFTAKDQEDEQIKQQQSVAVAAAASAKQQHLARTSTTTANKAPEQGKQVGRVRVLVSYKPNGLEPQQHDIVALESFARRPLRRSTITPILPPLMPLIVKEVRNRYVLVEYQLPVSSTARRNRSANIQDNINNNKACMRLHRNCVFVIERQNLVDATVGFAMRPADALMSTPIGQTGAQILGPALNAGKELLMPATLSIKLVFMAFKTGTLVGWSGVQAAGGAIWNESTRAWTSNQHERDARSYHHDHDDQDPNDS